MEKVLIYTNSWDEVKEIMGYYDSFSRGREIAWATNNDQLVQLLSVGKMLVVNHKTYNYDFVVSNEKFDAELVVSINDFIEVLK